MNIKRIINDYVECDEFEMKLINNKLKFYYYDKIEHFSNNKIVISNNNIKYNVIGKNMVIETMFKEMVVISGKINNIMIGTDDE